MGYSDLIVEKKDQIGYIIINRPEKRNAIATTPGGTVEQINLACYEMKDDPDIRAFIIKGAGDCFCSGFDLGRYDENVFNRPQDVPKSVEWIKDVSDEPWVRYARRPDAGLGKPESGGLSDRPLFWDCLWDNPTPSIAQVHSFCLGAGLWLINHCDVVYATPTAIFSYPPIRYGASVVLAILPPWLLGRRKQMWMALTGQCISAQEAYDSGLITKIVDEDKIDKEVEELALNIAKVPPATHMATKRVVNNYWEGLGLMQALRYSTSWVMMTENSNVPGHYFEFFELVRQKGVKQAYTEQREKWGFPDPIMDAEVARLKAKRG